MSDRKLPRLYAEGLAEFWLLAFVIGIGFAVGLGFALLLVEIAGRLVKWVLA